MAYYNARNPQQNPGQQNAPDFQSIPGQLWEALRSGAAGFKQGLIGKDLSFEQWQRERKRRQQGIPPQQYPSRNWLERLIRGR